MNVPSFWVSLTEDDSSVVVEFRPECIFEEDVESLSSKFPLIPGSQGSITLCTTQISQKLREMPPTADFDLTDPYSPPPSYNVLHDPHLKEYFQNPAMRARLIQKGFITKRGYVKCNLREFNLFRQWIRKVKLDRLHQDLRRQRTEEIQAWREKQELKQLIRDEELYSIMRMREEKAMILKERAQKRREAERRKYRKLEEEYRRRREKFQEEKLRGRDERECQQEKNIAAKNALKRREEEKGKKIKIRILAKNKEKDRSRQRMLEMRRQSLVEERRQKIKDQWKRRCSSSLYHLLERHLLEERERKEHKTNVARRMSMMERQRRRCEVFHDKCLQKRRFTMAQLYHDADLFLENLRRKRLRDLEQWKYKFERMRDGYQSSRGSLASQQGRSGQKRKLRLSSIWDLESSLRKDFGIEDNVLYSGVVFADTRPRRATLETVEEEEADTEQERRDNLLAKIEAEIAVRDQVHHVVFGVISDAQNVKAMEELGVAGERAKAVQKYVQGIIDAAQEVHDKARSVVEDAIEKGKEQYREELRREESDTREIVSTATSSALQSFKRERRTVSATARDLARGALKTTKDSLERLYGIPFELVDDEGDRVAQEVSQNLAESAKAIAAAAMVSATRSLEFSLGKADPELVEARALAANAVNAARASLEHLYGFTIELEYASEPETLKNLAESAKDIAATAIISATASLERGIDSDECNVIAARSLASEAVGAARASLELLYSVEVDDEDTGEGRLTCHGILRRLSQTAKDVAIAAIVSAERSLEKVTKKHECESIAARSLASDAISAAKASLERLYNISVEDEIEGFDHQMSECLTESAKEISEAAILSARRSLEQMMAGDDFKVIAARSLANDAIKEAKASLERLYGVIIDVRDEDFLSTEQVAHTLNVVVRDVAASTIVSASHSLDLTSQENDSCGAVARSLATDALCAARVSIERLFGVEGLKEGRHSHAAKQIASAAVVSATRSLDVAMEEQDLSLIIAAQGLASDAVGSAKASLERLYGTKVEEEESSKIRDREMCKSLVENAKDIADVAIANASQSMIRAYVNQHRDLGTATRELVIHALDSAKTLPKRTGGVTFDILDTTGNWKSLDSEEPYATAAVTSTLRTLERARGEQNQEREVHNLMRTAQSLADDALQSAKESIESLYSITVELEDNINKTATDISRALVDSSGNTAQQLESEGLREVTQELACRAIVSASKAFVNQTRGKMSLDNLVATDRSLLEAAAKVSEISALVSSDELFDRGLLGGAEMEAAAKYLACQALRSADSLLERMKDEDRSMACEFEVCKAASEIASHDRDKTTLRFSATGPEKGKALADIESIPGAGALFGQVMVYVESIINSTLRYLGSPRILSDASEPDIAEYVILHADEMTTVDKESNIVNEDDAYRKEIVALKASRVVNDTLENSIEIVTTSMKNDAFFSSPEVKPDASRLRRRRSSSVRFNENTILHNRRDSYVPRESDFVSAVKRPPTPRFRNDRAGSIVSHEIEELENELGISSIDYTITDNLRDSVERCASDLEPVVLSGAAKGESASSSKIDEVTQDGDLGHALARQTSLYDIIKGREERASCDVSPCSSYVVLPRLDPSERSMISARLESLDCFSHQRKSMGSGSSLPSLSPKGSIVACGAAAVIPSKVDEEPAKLSTSTSHLPDIRDSARVTSDSGSNSSTSISATPTNQTSRCSSKKQKSLLVSPRASKENAKLSSCSSKDKSALSPGSSERKIEAVSSTSLAKEDARPRGFSGKVMVSQRASLKKGKLSPHASSEKVTSPASSKKNLSPGTSTERVVLSKRSSPQELTKSSGASKGNGSLSANDSTEKQASTSKGNNAPSRRPSVEKSAMSPSASKGKVALSPLVITEKASLSPSVSKSKVTMPGSASAGKASASRTSSSSSLEKRTVTPRSSKTKASLSPSSSTLKAKLSPRASKHQTTEAPVSSDSSSKTAVASPKDSITGSAKTSTVLKKPEGEFSPLFSEDADTDKIQNVQSSDHSKDLLPTDGSGCPVKEASLEDATTDLNKKGTSDKPKEEPSETDAAKNIPKAAYSLDRIIHERRLTPEGAEAEPRPTSKAGTTGFKMQSASQTTATVYVETAETTTASLKGVPTRSSSSSADIVKTSRRSIGEGSFTTLSIQKKTVKPKDDDTKDGPVSRKKPEGKDCDEETDLLPSDKVRDATSFTAYGPTTKEKEPSVLDDTRQSSVSRKETQLGPSSSRAPLSGTDICPVARKVSVSSSINDTMETILNRTLSTNDISTEPEPTAYRRPCEEGSRDRKMRGEVSKINGKRETIPAAKVSKSVVDTVELMVQSASSSDGRRSGRRFQGSRPGYGVPQEASKERLLRDSSSSQELPYMLDVQPTPPAVPKPKLPSPKTSRLKATFSEETLGLRATQSDSSIGSSSSDKATDLRPKVSGAWLEGDPSGHDAAAAAAKESQPKRPQSSPSSSQHRSSAGRVSSWDSLRAGAAVDSQGSVVKP